jgi:hypothetical protein
MSMPKLRLRVWLAWAALLAAAPAVCQAQEANTSARPLPPVLKDVRWQYLDRKYQDVFVDGGGRAWFLIREFPTSAGGKLPTVALACPEAPDDYIEIPGENGLIGFDSLDRFWEVGKYGLCCTDVRTGKFTQRKPVPGVDLSRWPANWGKWTPAFGVRMLEHSTGRLYFVDSVGVHVLDGDRWSYEPLLSPGLNWVGSDRQYCGVKMAEAPDGKVIVWFSGDYVKEVFVHDGASWTRYSAKDHPGLDHPWDIVPEGEGWVKVTRSYGVTTRVKLYDAAPAPRVAATRSAVKRFGADYLADAGEELSLNGTTLARDNAGRVYFSVRDQAMFDGFVRLAVFDARQAADEPTLKYQAFRLHRTGDYRALTVDSQGGIWARLAVEDQPFLSRYADGKWVHYPDPAAASAEASKGVLAQYGMHWVMQPPSAAPNWVPDWKVATKGVPSMANPAMLLALKNGCMIASEDFEQRAFLFDGRGWQAFESLKVMVETKYDWLKENLDTRGMGWQRSASVGLDAAGRVWASTGFASGFQGAYDGNRWLNAPKGLFEFNAKGDRCLGGGFLLDTSAWPPKELAGYQWQYHSSPPRELAGIGSGYYYPHWGRLRADSKGKATPADPFVAESYAPGKPADNTAFAEGTSQTGGGRVYWLCYNNLEKTPSSNLQAIWPDGKRSKPFQHPLRMDSLVVHQGGNVYWAAASDGLLRLRLEGEGNAARILLDKQYPRIIPQGKVDWMGIGSDGALWMATLSGKSGLYRIEIPPVAEGSP